MNFTELYDDIYYCIFRQIKNIYTKYLHVNRHFYHLREKFLIQYYYDDKRSQIHKKRHPLPFILLYYYMPYRCAHDRLVCDTITHMMEFICNKNRHRMVYACKNKAHRKLARHLFGTHNLSYVTFIEKKPSTHSYCLRCNSDNIKCINNALIYYKYKMYPIHCMDCGNILHTKDLSNFRKVILVNKKLFI